jgi:poly(A) polymerase
MADLMPRAPQRRPLLWPDVVLDLQDVLLDLDLPPLYIVGGAVRDALLHRPVKDLDLATAGPAIQVARRITNALNGDIFVMDQQREVARVFVTLPNQPPEQGRITLDIARFREASLLGDLQERDFTVNAMAVDLLGDLSQLIDPLQGEPDMNAKILRRCAPHAIASDPIRALRAVRQSVQLKMRIEPSTLQDVRAQGARLNEASLERVRDEFFNLLALDNVAGALRIADKLGLLAAILPDLPQIKGADDDSWQRKLLTVEKMRRLLDGISYRRTDNTAAVFDLGTLVMQLDRYRAQLNAHTGHMWPSERKHEALLILGTLLHAMQATDMTQVQAVSARTADQLRLSNPEKQRLLVMTVNHRLVIEQATRQALEQHRFWYQLDEAGIDAVLLALASYLGQVGTEIQQKAWLMMVENARALLEAYFDRYEQIVRPQPYLTGKDLMTQFGLSAGPIIGDLLTHLREEQATGAITSRDDAMNAVRAYLDRA